MAMMHTACTPRTSEGERTGLIPKIIKLWKERRELGEEKNQISVEKIDLAQAEILNRQRKRAEILKEMYLEVLQKEPKDLEEFSGFRDAMVQGATFEGIYNGFTHSSNYRRLEVNHPGASLNAVRIFAEELEILERELLEKTVFNSKSALPLPKFINPALSYSRRESVEHGGAQKGEASIAYYTRLFYMASIFTLKRVLGDEAMKVIDLKRVNRDELARWYGNWATRLVERQVDFGLPLRNKPDAEFHYQWAMSASEDLLRWEVLNRLHRLMNKENRKKL